MKIRSALLILAGAVVGAVGHGVWSSEQVATLGLDGARLAAGELGSLLVNVAGGDRVELSLSSTYWNPGDYGEVRLLARQGDVVVHEEILVISPTHGAWPALALQKTVVAPRDGVLEISLAARAHGGRSPSSEAQTRGGELRVSAEHTAETVARRLRAVFGA